MEEINTTVKTFINYFNIKDEYNYVGDIDQDYVCSICMCAFIEPIMHNKCKNMFCYKCIEKLDECPLCRSIMKNEINNNFPKFLTNKLNQLKIYCLLDKEHHIERNNIHNHIYQDNHYCPLNCGEIINKTNIKNHHKECLEFNIKC